MTCVLAPGCASKEDRWTPHSPLFPLRSDAMLQLQEQGFIDAMDLTYFAPTQCGVNTGQIPQVTLDLVGGVFIVLAALMAAGLLLYFVAVLHPSWSLDSSRVGTTGAGGIKDAQDQGTFSFPLPTHLRKSTTFCSQASLVAASLSEKVIASSTSKIEQSFRIGSLKTSLTELSVSAKSWTLGRSSQATDVVTAVVSSKVGGH